MPARILLIGLDGCDPALIRAWMEDGSCPNMAAVAERGGFVPLNSTQPPFTYPAWTTLLTGMNPGKHGVFDFAIRTPGTYDLNFINAGVRRSPTIFQILSRHGRRVGAMGFPATYPPDPVNGFMISGFDSPVAVHADPSFCYPRSLYRELKKRVSTYTLTGFQELRIGKNWHRNALSKMIRMIDRRAEIAGYLLAKDQYDLFAVVFSETDTVSHHFWSFYDDLSPRHIPAEESLKNGIRSVYRRIDDAVGRLAGTLGGHDHLFIVSDHGFGGNGHRMVSINRMLAQLGYFKFAVPDTQRSAGGLPRRILPFVPSGIQQMLFRRTNARIPARLESRMRLAHADLPKCIAFSDELNYFPSVWIHDQRFPRGTGYTTRDRKQLLTDLQSGLLSVRNPFTGRPLLRGVHDRRDLYHGDCLELAPDLVLEFDLDAGYTYPVTRMTTPGPVLEEMAPEARLGRKGTSMNGSHRPQGVLLCCGPDIAFQPRAASPSLEDIAPTLMYLLDLPIPSDMDGHVMKDFFHPETVHRKPACCGEPVAQRKASANRLPQRDEQQALEDKLKDLGYLE